MDVCVDLLDPRSGMFFISVQLGRYSLSFDYTTKAHRVLKQVWVKKVKTKEKPSGTWETLRILDGKPKGTTKVTWIDKGEVDIANGNAYEKVWEKPMPIRLKNDLLAFSSNIYKNKDNLKEIKPILMKLDFYAKRLVEKYY